MTTEIRVRPVTRYIVTEWHENADGKSEGSTVIGEFDNVAMANWVASAIHAIIPTPAKLSKLPDGSQSPREV